MIMWLIIMGVTLAIALTGVVFLITRVRGICRHH